MPLALSELFVTLSARTAGFDNAIASTHAKMGSLSTQFGRTRDANGRFVAGMGGGAAAIGRAGGSFSGFSAGLAGIRSGLGATATAVGTFAGNIASRVAAAAAPLAKNVLGGAALDMEKRIVTLAKALPETGPGIDEMRKGIFDLSTTIKGVKLDDLLDIATTGAKMGVSGDGILKFTEGIAKASTAVDDMSALELAESVGKVNVVFKLGENGALQLSSAFDKLADSGISSFSGITNVVSRLSGTADAAGLTAQETAALAAALLDTGSNAELGATSIQRLIVALNDAGSRATFAKVLGVSTDEFAQKVKTSPIQAIQEFLQALNGLDAGSQGIALGGIGIEGIQAQGELQKLAAQYQIVGRNVGLANHEFRTLDQVTKSYAATAALTGAQLTQDANRFQIMAVTVGDQLLPVIGAASAAFGAFATSLTAAFAGNQADFAGFRDGFLEAAASVGTAVGTVIQWVTVEWPQGFAIAFLKAEQALANTGEAFVFLKDVAVAALTFVGDFAVNIFDRVTANIRNLFNGVGTAIENVLTGNVGDVFRGEIDLFKGFTPERTQDLLPEFKAPELKFSTNQVIGELEAEQAGRRMGDAMAAGLGDVAGDFVNGDGGASWGEAAGRAIAAATPAAGAFIGPPRPEGLAAAVPGEKASFTPDDEAKKKKKDADAFKSESIGLADFATRFRQAQLTGKDKDAEARKEAELNRIALKENTKALQQQMKGFGLA